MNHIECSPRELNNRLLVREDNADLRLRKIGYEIGLVSKKEYEQTVEKQKIIEEVISELKKKKIFSTTKNNKILKAHGLAIVKEAVPLNKLLRRPGIDLKIIKEMGLYNKEFTRDIVWGVENQIKYEGYIKKQLQEVKRFSNLEKIKIPKNFNYANVLGLSTEIKHKLKDMQPVCLGQASRISGVTPVAISVLMVWLRKK